MNYRLNLFLLVIVFASCTNNKKPTAVSNDTVSIHKIWRYDNVRSNASNPGVIGKHLLDLTNKDTLHFSYQSIKDNSTAYAYQILHDTVFVNKNPAYKIIILTASELELYTLFKSDSSRIAKDSIIMIYKNK
ncbi:hypothetical protein [Mucilaginibacter sp.]